MSGAPLKVWFDRGGRLLRLRLARPKANVLDAEMIGALATGAAHAVNDMPGGPGVCLPPAAPDRPRGGGRRARPCYGPPSRLWPPRLHRRRP